MVKPAKTKGGRQYGVECVHGTDGKHLLCGDVVVGEEKLLDIILSLVKVPVVIRKAVVSLVFLIIRMSGKRG